MVRVPTTERGVDGFVKNIHDALAGEKSVAFEGNHTVVARILCEIAPPIPKFRQIALVPASATVNVNILKTLIRVSDKRYRLSVSGDMDKFKRDLNREAKSGKRIVFAGDHAVIARIFQSRLIRQHITNVLISEMKRDGLPPWRKPWVQMERPRSGRTGKPYYYAPFNAFRLNSVAIERGYTDPRWITLEYAQKTGRPIRKKERGRGIAIVRAYPNPVIVYNWEQREGAETAPRWASRRRPALPKAESVINAYLRREKRLGLRLRAPNSEEEADEASYSSFQDLIVMPHKRLFPKAAGYYMTAFHEIAHSTGHSKRRDRHDGDSELAPFGSPRYAYEELVAEIAACLIAAGTDLAEQFQDAYAREGTEAQNSAAYLRSWLNAISENPSVLYRASEEAEHAYKYALDVDRHRKKSRDRADKRERNRKARARKRR